MPAISKAAEPVVIDLWPAPGGAPGETKQLPPEVDANKPTDGLVAGKPVIRLTNVSEPTVTLYLAPPQKNTGTTVVVCPGGGYNILAINHEGTEVAAWLTSIGVNAALLKYRVPIERDTGRTRLQPQQDAQRAMRLLRQRAAEFDLAPDRIGILGFSAGAHLALMTCQNVNDKLYDPVDEADAVSSRPDFAVLLYIGWVTDGEGNVNPDIHIDANTPPLFIMHATDDKVSSAVNSIQLAMLAKKAGVSTELILYPTGGHGFGIRRTDQLCTTWPDRCAEWMAAMGWMGRE